MRRWYQTKLLLTCIVAVALSGCAHKNLIEDGQQFEQAGRYEMAVEQYQKALELKPKDSKTRQKLALAQQSLDLWLDELLQQADTAKTRGLKGRALILYSKVAQLRRDAHALAQYKSLHQQLKSQARYRLAINSPKALGNNIGDGLADVIITEQAELDQANQFTLAVKAAQPTFKTTSTIKEVTQSYVSGSETVANPDYLDLQQHIGEHRDNIDHLQGDYAHKRDELDGLHHRLTILEKDLQIARLSLAQAKPKQQNYWRAEVDRRHHLVVDQQNRYNHARHQFDDLAHQIDDQQAQLNKALNELSYLPPTIEQDVYSDHSYRVEKVTRTGAGKLTVSFSGANNSFTHADQIRSKTVKASYSDEGHDEQPRLDLAFNPVKLQSDQNIGRKYYQNSKVQTQSAIIKHLKDYRQHLRNRADQANGIDHKLEAWVHYGLSGSNGVDHSTQSAMTQQLKQEYGIAGEFNVNELLYLFGY
jgi:exonuclease VII small subunit